MSCEVKQLDEIINPILKNGRKVISYECKRLLPHGENFGSVMLQVQINVLNENNGEKEVINCVGKTCPPNEMLLKLYNTKVTFKMEIGVYQSIAPAYLEFGLEKGFDRPLDFFAKCLGARISLDPSSDTVDGDAILLLENLQADGYNLGDKFTGFDMECTKFLLSDLAMFHATAIAYRLAKPDDFNKRIRPYLNKDFCFDFESRVVEEAIKKIQKMLGKNQECRPHLLKIGDAVRKLVSYKLDNPLNERELYATFAHGDYWVNNIMLKLENGKPVSSKMIDFQFSEYRSLAHDVVFFLYSSVELSVLEKSIDDLYKYYFEEFVANLKKLGCDTGKFVFEDMLEECGYIGREEELGHILILMPTIMILRDKAKETSDLKQDDVVMDEDAIHENCWKKLTFVLLDFVKRGWI